MSKLIKNDQSYKLKASIILACLFITGIPNCVLGASRSKKSTVHVKKESGAIIMKSNFSAPYRVWLPSKGKPKIVLLCIHGLGLNSASYAKFGQRMASLGIATYAIDVRGFGTWMKLEGKEQIDFDGCLSDIEKALKVLHSIYPRLPVYILGESMGGAIALRITATHPELVDGLVSAVPSGDRFHTTRNQLRVALHLVTGGKDKPMDVGSRVIEDATDDPAVREQWKDDPLNRMQLTPKELMQFRRFMNDNHDTAKQIEHEPVLMICGFKDRLVKPQGTVELFNEMTTPDKMLVILGNGEHLIFEEGQLTDQACWVLTNWLEHHAKSKAASTHKAIKH